VGALFQHQQGRALADHEAIAPGVERPRGSLRFVVAGADGPHDAEAGQAQGQDARLGPTGDHHVGRAAPDHGRRLAQGVVAAGAGGVDGQVRPGQTVGDGDGGRRRVGQHHVDEEGAEAARPAGGQRVSRFVDGVERAHAAADDDAGAGAGSRVVAQTGVGQGVAGRGQRQLRQPGHAAGFLAAEAGHRVEVSHFAGNTRFVVRGVEQGDGADAGLTGADRRPGSGGVIAQRVERAEAGDNDTAQMGCFHHRLV